MRPTRIHYSPVFEEQFRTLVHSFGLQSGFIIGDEMGDSVVLTGIYPCGPDTASLERQYPLFWETYGNRLMGPFIKGPVPERDAWFSGDLAMRIRNDGQRTLYRVSCDPPFEWEPLQASESE